MTPQNTYWQALGNWRVGIMLFLGFSSGLPRALTSGTLQAWLTVEGVDLRTIGLFTLVGVPYTLKFLWSPIMDRFVPPWMGRRRGWMLTTQIGLMVGIAAIGFSSPRHAPLALAALALAVAFLSASQDVAFDAYRADVLHARERGMGAGVSVFGYRIAMIVSGALALIVADSAGWLSTYLFMAGLLIIGVVATISAPEPEVRVTPPRTLMEAVVGPMRDFFGRPGAVLLLATVVLYKLGDAFASSLSTAFLLRGVGFSLIDVGVVNKGMGVAATLLGVLIGGGLMVRLGLFRSLMLFGFLQAISNLSFMLLAWVGKSYGLMVLAVGLENITGGMGTAALVAFMMALCNHRYTATQYALLSALATIGSLYMGPVAGYTVEWLGWVAFFFVTALVALPGLWFLWRMRADVMALEHIGTEIRAS